MPGRNGLSSTLMSSKVDVMTIVTPPMRVAWTIVPSPLSAKKSMNQKMTAAEMNSTSQSDDAG